MHGIQALGGFLVVTLLTIGPIVGLLMLLNRCDRRREHLLRMVCRHAPAELAGRITVRVWCALILPRSTVFVELEHCSRDEVWEAMARWSVALPRQTLVLVNGAVLLDPSACLALRTGGPWPGDRRARITAAAG